MVATANLITMPKTGLYLVIGSVQYVLPVGGPVSLQVYCITGSYIVCRCENISGNYASGIGGQFWQTSDIRNFNAGDQIQLATYQNYTVFPAAATVQCSLTSLSASFICDGLIYS